MHVQQMKFTWKIFFNPMSTVRFTTFKTACANETFVYVGQTKFTFSSLDKSNEKLLAEVIF